MIAALFGRVAPDGHAEVEAILPTELLLRLFRGMERRDQRHAIAVVRRLKTDGVGEADLLVAALLHDCGKGSVPVWLRIAYVLTPAIVLRVGREDGDGWSGAAHRLAAHAACGAGLAAAAGATAATVRLISGTVEASEREMLHLLRRADDAS